MNDGPRLYLRTAAHVWSSSHHARPVSVCVVDGGCSLFCSDLQSWEALCGLASNNAPMDTYLHSLSVLFVSLRLLCSCACSPVLVCFLCSWFSPLWFSDLSLFLNCQFGLSFTCLLSLAFCILFFYEIWILG